MLMIRTSTLLLLLLFYGLISYLSATDAQTKTTFHFRPISTCKGHEMEKISPKELPLIAIMAGSTTRKVNDPGTNTIALFTVLLPSLLRSLDCGYRYVYMLGFDTGDEYYDSDVGMSLVKKWFSKEMTEVLKENGIEMSLTPVRVVNEMKKPGPVFNTMARVAYTMGADYFYRLNDDSEVRGRWPLAYVSSLQSLGPPFGVIGPASYGSNDRILTHDFVHRTHMEIFEMNYYPPELPDWWMDDWISSIYGRHRTILSKNIGVQHHYFRHGQRYAVNRGNEHHLIPATMRGRQLIRNWMLKHDLNVTSFDKQLSTTTTKRAAGSGYDLKIRYIHMVDSTPNAAEIALQESNYLEPNKKIVPGNGQGEGIKQWGISRFKPQGNKIKIKGKGKGTGKGRGRGRGAGTGAGSRGKGSLGEVSHKQPQSY